MMAAMPIVEFLLARLAEDEQVAELASVPDDPPHSVHRGDVVGVVDPACPTCVRLAGVTRDRMLAECQAKRDLIELATGLEYLRDVGDPDAPKHALGDEILRVLAAVYADHEAFQVEWRL